MIDNLVRGDTQGRKLFENGDTYGRMLIVRRAGNAHERTRAVVRATHQQLFIVTLPVSP